MNIGNTMSDIQTREEPNDIFYTPSALAKDLIMFVDIEPNHKLLDPFKGKGAFYDNYPKENEKDWFEIDQNRDFFKINKKYDWMISNPPFSKTNEIIEKSCMYSNIGFAYLWPTYTLSYSRLKKIESFGFYLDSIVYFENPKEWKIGFQMAFFIFTKKRSDSIKLIEECDAIQQRLF